MKKTLALVLALLMALSLFAACGKKETAESAKDSKPQTAAAFTNNTAALEASSVEDTILGTQQEAVDTSKVHPSDDATLKVAWNFEPGGLTQPGHAFSSNMNPSYIFGQCLLKWDGAANDVAPQIATSWEWIDDLTLRLHLRDDVTSIAGDPFTAKDVIFTWNWCNDTPSLASYYGIFDYEKTKAIDDYTVDIALLEPYPFLTIDLAHTAYIVACEESAKRIGLDKTDRDPSAQTGPYKLVKWDEGQCVYCERRDDYWDPLPYYKYVELWTVSDTNTRCMGVEAGDYDIAMNPSTTATLAAETSTKATGWFVAGAGAIANFVFNSDLEPLNIKEARQAVALAINYEAQLQIALSGKGILTSNALCSPYNTYYTEPSDPEKNFMRYDPELAKQKLVEAGYPNGFTINCKYRTAEAMTVASAEMLVNQLGEVGITLQLVPQESAAWYADMRAGDWNTHLSVGGNPNPKRNITTIDGTRIDHNAATGSAGKNWAPEGTVELIDRCLQTVDDEKRMEAFRELNDVCCEYVPMVILYCPWKTALTSSEIVGFNVTSMGAVDVCSVYPQEYIAE